MFMLHWQIEGRDQPLTKYHIKLRFVCNSRALSKFEEQDFLGVKEDLELVPGASLDDIGREGNGNMADSGWGTSALLQSSHRQLIRAATYAHTTPDWRTELWVYLHKSSLLVSLKMVSVASTD